jgi:hypothetical protein
MAQKRNSTVKERQIGKNVIAKKPLIDPRYKNTIWTVVFLVVMLFFFIMNNTGQSTERGPYPPTFNPSNHDQPSKKVGSELDLVTHK